MKTGEDGCAPKGSRKRVRVAGNAAPQLRSELEGLVAHSLEAKERADKARIWTPYGLDQELPPMERKAYADLLFNLHMGRKCLESAEGALDSAKRSFAPEEAKRVRRLIRLGYEAASEALAEIYPVKSESHALTVVL
jgi:hypothetical protein